MSSKPYTLSYVKEGKKSIHIHDIEDQNVTYV